MFQLFCALEEWENGVYTPVDFAVDNYHEMYNVLTQVNIRGVLDDPYLRGKLEAMWAGLYNRAW
jgi:hypothetical protein